MIPTAGQHILKFSVVINKPLLECCGKRFISSQVQALKHYDIIVAGGGLIGTTLACTLGKNSRLSDRKILLLDRIKQQVFTPSATYSNRVSSLNPGTIQLFKDIDVWKHIQAGRYAIVKKMQVWDAISNTMIAFDNNELGEAVAYIVENNLVSDAVSKEIKNAKNVEVMYETNVKTYQIQDHEKNVNTVTLENGTTYTCDLLLGCDGYNSQVRKSMGVHYLSWNYDQMGVVATLKIKTESPDNTVAWQRFLPTGPVGILPLTKDLSSIVWSTSPKHAKELLSLTEEQFVDALNDAVWKTYKREEIVDRATKFFDNMLGYLNCPSNAIRQLPPKIVECEKGSRAAFPLGFGHSSSYIGKGVVLVGDAAHRVHPLAGQGVNLGFGDITCINRVLGEAAYAGSKIDNPSYLKRYESERQRHNIPTMLAIEGLHRLYNNEFTPLVLLRSLGLQATNVLTPLKKAIMSQAST